MQVLAVRTQGQDARRVHASQGGYGFMRDRPILRAFADARGLRSHAGTSGMMKVIIARAPWDFVSP